MTSPTAELDPAAAAAADRGGVLVLRAPSPVVQRVLRVSGLHRVFETAPE